MAFDAGAVFGRAIMDNSGWKKGANEVQKSTKGMTGSLFKAQLAFAAFSKVITATADVIKKSINISRDFQEENSKFKTVFKDVGEAADKMRKQLQNSYGLSRKNSTQLLAATGDLLTGFGFAGDMALELSGEVQKLAIDLASFTNYAGGADGASQALTKALLGERESVKALGISILETDVKAKVLELTQQGMTFETERQAKAYATLLIAQEQSKNAIGDYARTSEGLANRQRQLTAVTEDLQVQIGNVFTPILNDLTKAALDSAKGLRNFLDSAKGIDKLSSVFSAVQTSVMVLQPVFEDLGNTLKTGIKDAINDIMPSFKRLGKEVTVFEAFAAVVEALNIAFTLAIKIIKLYVQALVDVVIILKNLIDLGSAFFTALFDPTKWGEAKKQAGELGDSFLQLGKNIKDNVTDLVTTAVDELKGYPEAIKDRAKETQDIWDANYEKNKQRYKNYMQDLNNITKEGTDDIDETLKNGGEDWKEKIKIAMGKMAEGFENFFEKALPKIKFFMDQFSSIWSGVNSIIQENLDSQLTQIQVQGQRQAELFETQRQNRLESLNDDFEERQELLGLQREQGLVSQEEYNEQASVLDEMKRAREEAINTKYDKKEENRKKQQLKKENEIKKKQFEQDKANAIVEALINLASSIVSIWTSSFAAFGNPIVAAIVAGLFTGVMTGLTIAQIAAISSQQFVPAKEKGGRASGLTKINEAGGEIITLPDGSQVIPNDISRQIAANTETSNRDVVINITGNQINSELDMRRLARIMNYELGRLA